MTRLWARRRWRAAGVVIVLVGVLTGCSAAVRPGVTGYAIPDAQTVNKHAASEFDAAVTAMKHNLETNINLHGVVFKHGAYGSKTQDNEISVTLIQASDGDVTSFAKSVTDVKHAGQNIDTLHAAGSPYDYWLMGTQFKSIAPKGWVRMPAVATGDGAAACVIEGIQTTCDLLNLIGLTAKEATPKPTVVKQFNIGGDGSITLTTGISVRALLADNYVANIPTSISKTFSPAALNTELPMKIVMSSAHRLQLIQISGSVPGSTPLVIQDGFLIDGAGDPSVIPAAPPASLTTILPDQAAANRWLAKLTAIQGV